MSDLIDAFDRKADEWHAYTQTPKGRLREMLNWHYVQPHLPPPPATVLDVGAGTGGLGIMFAQAGYTTHLLDLSPAMLSIAQQHAAAQDLHFSIHTLGLSDFIPPGDGFDVICCHTVLAYVSDMPAALKRMAQWLKPDGVLSVAFVNRYVEVLKAALLKGDWQQAHAQLSATSASADLFGVPRTLYNAETMLSALHNAGLMPVAEYGVRIFTDYNTHQNWQNNDVEFQQLFALETAAATHPTFRRIGRYGQIIARLKN